MDLQNIALCIEFRLKMYHHLKINVSILQYNFNSALSVYYNSLYLIGLLLFNFTFQSIRKRLSDLSPVILICSQQYDVDNCKAYIGEWKNIEWYWGFEKRCHSFWYWTKQMDSDGVHINLMLEISHCCCAETLAQIDIHIRFILDYYLFNTLRSKKWAPFKMNVYLNFVKLR